MSSYLTYFIALLSISVISVRCQEKKHQGYYVIGNDLNDTSFDSEKKEYNPNFFNPNGCIIGKSIAIVLTKDLYQLEIWIKDTSILNDNLNRHNDSMLYAVLRQFNNEKYLVSQICTDVEIINLVEHFDLIPNYSFNYVKLKKITNGDTLYLKAKIKISFREQNLKKELTFGETIVPIGYSGY